jgi:hypothetical protein
MIPYRKKCLDSLNSMKHHMPDLTCLKKWCRIGAAFLVIGVIIHCTGMRKPDEPDRKQFDFKIENTLASDDINSPLFFANILDVCTNSKYIYISDWKSYCIKIFDHHFNFIKKIGEKGDGPSQFGQILVDMACTDEKLYVITINRIYTFSANGDFENETVLRFLPGRIFPVPGGFVFKNTSSEYSFIVTDLKGNTVERFYKNKFITTKECGKIPAAPETFMSSKGYLFVLDSMRFNIERVNLSTKEINVMISRDVDYQGLSCRKNREGETEISGGYSWIIETGNSYYYFYYNSKMQLQIDIFSQLKNEKFELNESGEYTGDFHPLCASPGSEDTFIGFMGREYDVLVICKLEEI